MSEVQRAIIMAAGKGERMQPLTLKTPKPLISVHGVPMIESVIAGLNANGIHEIYVVTGYLKEQFAYLPDKYPGLELIENPDYDVSNNISSLFAARDHLENAMILDGDQMIYHPHILHTDFEKSGYACIYTNQPTKEWVLDVENNHVIRCHRNGADHGYQLYSISRWNREDGKKLKQALEEEYLQKQNTQIYWDDVALFCQPDRFDLGIDLIEQGEVCEIDSLAELAEIDPAYQSILVS